MKTITLDKIRYRIDVITINTQAAISNLEKEKSATAHHDFEKHLKIMKLKHKIKVLEDFINEL
jgi:hypothetical protein